MKKFTLRRMAAMLLCLVIMCSALSSCSLLVDGFVNAINEDTATIAVQGNLDILYHGQVNEDYLELLDGTEEELRKDYSDGLIMSAEYFAYYWGVLGETETLDMLDSALQQRMIDLIEDISLKTQYTVHPAQAQSNGYAVQVMIKPVDIMYTASDMYDDGSYAPLAAILAEAEAMDWENISEADYWGFANRYGNIIVDMVESLLPGLGYMDEKSVIIQMQEDADGYLQINGDDLANFDEQIIPYDYE